MDEKTDQEQREGKIKLLLEAYAQAEQHVRECVEIKNTVAGEMGYGGETGRPDYDNPFHSFTGELTDETKKLHTEVMKEVVTVYLQGRVGGVQYDRGAMVKECVEPGSKLLARLYQRMNALLAGKDDLAYGQILAEAQKFLPYAHREGSKPSKVEDFVDGRRLKLPYCSLFEESRYGGKVEWRLRPYDVAARIDALEKLGQAVLQGVAASYASSPWGGNLHQLRVYDAGDVERAIQPFQALSLQQTIRSLRFFKKGGVVAEYASPEDAMKVTRALLAKGVKP
jgi:hypothetical protein